MDGILQTLQQAYPLLLKLSTPWWLYLPMLLGVFLHSFLDMVPEKLQGCCTEKKKYVACGHQLVMNVLRMEVYRVTVVDRIRGQSKKGRESRLRRLRERKM
jgi:hypothetical protein